MKRILTLISSLLFLCASVASAQVRELPTPAGKGSGQPNLTVAPNGDVFLSWIEKLGEGRVSLRFAVKKSKSNEWSALQTVAEGTNWFVNWADFPSMIALPDGSLAAHWLVKSAEGTFDYDVNISRSLDKGKTWSKPFIPHRDGAKAEHGFVSMFAAKDGNLAAVWLDGREMKHDEGGGGHGHGNMTLRYVKILRDGSLTDEAVIDSRVCECCQTSAAMTADGPVVVYRDRSDQEIRDTSIVKNKNGKWSPPLSVHNDNWQINGCPVNGPSVSAIGKRVAVAWFTGAEKKPSANLSFSNDAGETFGKPIKIDDGNPAGRVETLLLKDGSALVVWLEKMSEGGAVRMRRVTTEGKVGEAVTVAASGTARSNGFPQMILSGKTLVFAWTGDKVMTATMPLP